MPSSPTLPRDTAWERASPWTVACALAILLDGSAAVLASPLQTPERPIVLRAGRMLDVRTGEIRRDMAMVVTAGRISSVGPAASLKVPDGADTIDLGRLTVLPGLIDAHVHLAWGAGSGGDAPDGAAARAALDTLRAGFTTVRNLGSTGMSDLRLRDLVRSGAVAGPRILAAGPGLGSKGGVCEAVFGGDGVADGVEAAARKVREMVQLGADVVKVCAGGGVLPSMGEAGATELGEAEIRAVVEAAHAKGLKVAAHAQGPAAIANAVRGGVDSIEHGSLLDEPTARMMREKGVHLVPTLYRLDWALETARQGGASASALEALAAGRAAAIEGARLAIRMGVPIAFGTDATVYPHGLNARELLVYEKLGMEPIEAIRTATLNAAALLGWADRLGSLEAGMLADLIGVEGSPLEDLRSLERVAFVMKEGVVHRNESTPSAAPPTEGRTPDGTGSGRTVPTDSRR